MTNTNSVFRSSLPLPVRDDDVNPKTVEQALRAARAILEDENRIVRYGANLAEKDSAGVNTACSPNNMTACRFCVIGAIWRVCLSDSEIEYISTRFVRLASEILCFCLDDMRHSLTHQQMTHADVLAVFDLAINLSRLPSN